MIDAICLSLQGFIMAIDNFYRIPKLRKQMAMAKRGR